MLTNPRALSTNPETLAKFDQVDALEDQKNRLTNGLEKLHATSEQARFRCCEGAGCWGVGFKGLAV